MNMKFKLTPLEKKWILYDVGNSAFAMLTATILPIYFNYLAKKAGLSSVDYLSYWGYAVSICTLLVAIMGPILGAIADVKDLKKKLFELFLFLGVFGCAMLGFVPSWFFFLIVFILTNTGYSASLIFYDAMLTDVTEPKRMDTVSSQGFAWGYVGLRPFYDWARIRFIRFKIRHFASESHDDCICHHCFLVAFNDASVIKSISAALLCRKNGKNGFQQPEALDNND